LLSGSDDKWYNDSLYSKVLFYSPPGGSCFVLTTYVHL
jgi:hypothetical protein